MCPPSCRYSTHDEKYGLEKIKSFLRTRSSFCNYTSERVLNVISPFKYYVGPQTKDEYNRFIESLYSTFSNNQ